MKEVFKLLDAALKLNTIEEWEHRIAKHDIIMMSKMPQYRSHVSYEHTSSDLRGMFRWDKSATGVEFWRKIDNALCEAEDMLKAQKSAR